jgi:hypothetical protein
MKLFLSNRPLLNAHVERWSKRVMEALGRRGGDKVGDVFVEEYLRELWERSRGRAQTNSIARLLEWQAVHSGFGNAMRDWCDHANLWRSLRESNPCFSLERAAS